MKITPSDIRNATFKRKFKGFDPEEVKIFLTMVSEEMENLLKEKVRLSGEVQELKAQLLDVQEKERMLKEIMLSTQKFVESLKENARREARIIVKDAELRAEEIIGGAQRHLKKIHDEITQLKIQRKEVEEKILGFINSIKETINLFKEKKEEEEKIAPLFKEE
ncbi:MAG: DivIVA domain-containing protein [Candidatus Aminicenantia bacterium]